MNSRKFFAETNLAALMALAAALLFGLNSPFAKMLLDGIPPMYMAAFLYLGAALGMSVILLVSGLKKGRQKEAGLAKRDAPWIALIILLDTVAPISLMFGLTLTTASNASLLYGFETVATAMFALLFFKEAIGRRMWLSIGLVTAASVFLSIDLASPTVFAFSTGSLLVLGACLCWGLENNCTRRLSEKNPIQIAVVKGFGAGIVALLLAFTGERMEIVSPTGITGALALGFVSYGLSIFLYISAQRKLGAARTGIYYAASPFFGVLIAIAFLGERPGAQFLIGAALMVAGTVLAIKERHAHAHMHPALVHEHRHSHADEHHMHGHETDINPETEHAHEHEHEALEHEHEHRPDIHHRHLHD